MWRIDFQRADAESFQRLSSCFAGGGVAAFPSESSYGLAASAFDPRGVRRILAMKSERGTKPLPLILSDPALVSQVALALPPLFSELTRAFWPGPLSVLVRARAEVAAEVLARGCFVAVRVPGHAAARWTAKAAGGAATATSANHSGEPPLDDPDALAKELGEALDCLVDDGACPGGAPSTIIDLFGSPPRILRPGRIRREAIEACLGIGIDSGGPDQ